MSPHRAKKPGRLLGHLRAQRLGELRGKKKQEQVAEGETADGEKVAVRIRARPVTVQTPRPASKARCPHRRQKSAPGHLPVRYYRPCGCRLKLKKHRGPEKLATCRDCGREWEVVEERVISPGQVQTQLRRWEPRADAAVRRQDAT